MDDDVVEVRQETKTAANRALGTGPEPAGPAWGVTKCVRALGVSVAGPHCTAFGVASEPSTVVSTVDRVGVPVDGRRSVRSDEEAQ